MTTTRINISIDTPSLEAGVSFYERVFGFKEVSRPLPHMAVMDANNVALCIHEKAEGTESSTAGSHLRNYQRHWTPVHLDFHVNEFEKCIRSIIAENGTVERTFDKPRPVAFCSDPFGNGFCVLGEN
ncbi:VOC family protein [Peteryoungia desertarenae]|uniref:VOC family protein n=1 Tax=Peteryoungia desertarenae TaxID=1813451 RepID=A0ABX6QN38_9HYPH|nr:VOC family protein [Peteryoungia desertarenae]QLF69929.1 VOC family protein [Peteryoungia desertarenae]